ncbi:MAG: dockerin type I repeat-containing protein [Candidatus Zixiibacteriota bacterium]
MKKGLFVCLAGLLFTFAACLDGICRTKPGDGTVNGGQGSAESEERYLVQAPVADGEDYFGIDSAGIRYSTSHPTPWIVVLSPDGGEEWCAGSTHDILWDCFDIGNVRIDYSIWAGSDWTWQPIIGSTPCAPGSYSWTLLGSPISASGVRVCALPYDDPCDHSNGTFSVIACSPGDANGDYVVDLADLVFLINYLFRLGEPPDPLANGDPNADCVVNLADLVYLVNYLYRNGDPPRIGCA